MRSTISQALRSTLQLVSADGRQASSAVLREEILDHGLNARRARALAESLEQEGQLLEAVATLQMANRLKRDATVERHLVRLRQAAFASIERKWPPGSVDWPGSTLLPSVTDAPLRSAAPAAVVTDSPGPPVLHASDLSSAVLREGILRHGSVLVRGLVGPERVARLVKDIDQAFAAFDERAAGVPLSRTTPWFDPLEAGRDAEILRAFVRNAAGVWTADSPRALYEFLETISELGLDRLITCYLGERPALSLEKCILRRAEPTQAGSGWHQDGAFIGQGIRSISAWFSLSHCGRTAPGLDIIPVRLDRVLPAGTKGALYDWDVSAEVVREEFPNLPVWRPQLEPGDVIFFDHLCLHRTAVDASMTERRWAIESWFFAPSVFPATQTPLVV